MQSKTESSINNSSEESPLKGSRKRRLVADGRSGDSFGFCFLKIKKNSSMSHMDGNDPV